MASAQLGRISKCSCSGLLGPTRVLASNPGAFPQHPAHWVKTGEGLPPPASEEAGRNREVAVPQPWVAQGLCSSTAPTATPATEGGSREQLVRSAALSHVARPGETYSGGHTGTCVPWGTKTNGGNNPSVHQQVKATVTLRVSFYHKRGDTLTHAV